MIIGLAIDVHRNVRPGLLQSVYSACPCLELEQVRLPFEREVMVPATNKGAAIPLGFRADNRGRENDHP
jgi:GxxExxY protein